MPSKKNVVLLLINPVLNKNKDNSIDNKEVTGTINQSNNVWHLSFDELNNNLS